MNKKIFLTIIIVIIFVLVFGIYKVFLKEEESNFTLEKVTKGNVSQEISETGVVNISEETNLGFKDMGRIEKIYVEVGDIVDSGTPLVKLETTELKIQLQGYRASLDYSQARLAKLLAGATEEEIALSEAQVNTAKISLEDKKQDLENVQATSEENLNQAYEDALNTLDESYLEIYNSFNTVDLIQRTYFYSSDQESLRVKENESKIKTARDRTKSYLDIAKDNSTNENIDTALSEMKSSLAIVSEALVIIRDTCDESVYRNSVLDADKTSLDTQKTNINTAQSNITNSQQTISSAKLTNQSNINTAQSKVSAAESALAEAEKKLAKILAAPVQEDVDVYQAEVKQAEAKIALLENQIKEVTLFSPVKGQIIEINKRVGETVQITDSVISLIPSSPFQIKVDIYEEDIVKVKIENPVDITLVAFPDEILKGKVISINPAEKLIGGVVYYEVTIDFEEQKEGVKPGMTADIVIKTAFKENVLVIGKDALQKKNGKSVVQVFKAGEIQEREIEVGLKGSNNLVEVISGLEIGEEVVLE